MIVEREAKLAAPESFALPDFAPLGIVARPLAARQYATRYLDTPDLRLARWGCGLRHRQGEGWTLKLALGSDGRLLQRHELAFAGEAHRLPEEAADLVRALVRTSALATVARFATRRRGLELATPDGLPLATLTDDEVRVLDGDRVVRRFRELEVELAPSASPDALGPIVAALRAAGAGPIDNLPKLARALGAQAAEPEIALPALGPAATVGDVARHALGTAVCRLIRHDPGVRLGDDPESVHQARVAARRLRSTLRSLHAHLDADWASWLRAQLRGLGTELGAVRDAEVLRDRLLAGADHLPAADRPAVEALVGRLEHQRIGARERLLAGMRAPGYARLLDRLVAAARSPELAEDGEARPAAPALRPVLATHWKRLRRAAEGAGASPTPPALHRVRIAAKRLRYAAEDLAPVFGEPLRLLARAAEALQDVLGEHQDAVVAAAWLEQAAAASPREVGAAGGLSRLEAEARAASAAAWPAAWEAVRRRRPRSWA